MNLINHIQRKEFLCRLFPNGIVGPVFFGQIEFDVGGRLKLCLHTKNQPAISVKKWGEWGRDYNVLVMKFVGVVAEEVILRNWKKACYEDMDFFVRNGRLVLSQTGDDWSLLIETDGLIFQECNVYLEED